MHFGWPAPMSGQVETPASDRGSTDRKLQDVCACRRCGVSPTAYARRCSRTGGLGRRCPFTRMQRVAHARPARRSDRNGSRNLTVEVLTGRRLKRGTQLGHGLTRHPQPMQQHRRRAHLTHRPRRPPLTRAERRNRNQTDQSVVDVVEVSARPRRGWAWVWGTGRLRTNRPTRTRTRRTRRMRARPAGVHAAPAGAAAVRNCSAGMPRCSPRRTSSSARKGTSPVVR